MGQKIVTVVGATGRLGTEIVKALLEKGAKVRAMIRPTSDRSKLEALGVSDFVIADMLDPESLKSALHSEPKTDAIVASAAGYTRHSKGDTEKIDTEGYKNLVDATAEAMIARFVLISILECDKAVTVSHFYHKYLVEEHLKKAKQPYIALRPGAFLDQGRDMLTPMLAKGIYPALFPGVGLGMVYTPDLARYAAIAAVSLPSSALGRSVDIGWDGSADGEGLARAFSEVLKRPIVAKPAFPPFAAKVVMPLASLFNPGVRDMTAMMRWIGTGAYVSRDPKTQKELFGELPTVEEAVRRYCKDRSLV
jgi:uncharacterized protein YbjT (DUF2867 family)